MGGETSDKEELGKKIESVKGKGVFIEEFLDLISKTGLTMKTLSIDESDIEESVENLIEKIKLD